MSKLFSEPEFLVPGIGLIWLLFVLGLWGVFSARKFDKLGTLEFSKEGVSVELGVRITNFKWKDFDEINFCYLNSPVRDQRIPLFNQIERCFLAFTIDGEKHFYYYAMSIQEMAQCSQNLAVHLESLGLLKLKTFNIYGGNDIPKEVEVIKKDYLNE